MNAHASVAYASSFELDQRPAAEGPRRRRSTPFLIVSLLIATFLLLAAMLTVVVVVIAVLAVYLVILMDAVNWGLIHPRPYAMTRRQGVRHAVEALHGAITGTRRGGEIGP